MNRRSRITGLVLATASAAVAGFWLTATTGRATPVRSAIGPPRIELQIIEKSLGRIDADQLAAVEFPVRNRGAERLVINEADSRCGCADPDGRTYIIPPGGEGFLPISLDPAAAAGPLRKTNSYTTNDPACPKFELSVSALVL